MIYTEIANIGHYRGLGKYLDKAVDYLSRHPLDNIQAGHYEIDGDMVYMNVFDYETISEEGAFFEAHKKVCGHSYDCDRRRNRWGIRYVQSNGKNF